MGRPWSRSKHWLSLPLTQEWRKVECGNVLVIEPLEKDSRGANEQSKENVLVKQQAVQKCDGSKL